MVKGYKLCFVELMLMKLPLSARSFRISGGSSKDEETNRKYSSGIGWTLSKYEWQGN
jgi:hypothetical protein